MLVIPFFLSYLWFRSVEFDLGAARAQYVRMNPHRRRQLRSMRLELWGSTAGAGGMMSFTLMAILCVMLLAMLVLPATHGVLELALAHLLNFVLALQVAQWLVWMIEGPRLYEIGHNARVKPSQMIRVGDANFRNYLLAVLAVAVTLVVAAYAFAQGPMPFPFGATA